MVPAAYAVNGAPRREVHPPRISRTNLQAKNVRLQAPKPITLLLIGRVSTWCTCEISARVTCLTVQDCLQASSSKKASKLFQAYRELPGCLAMSSASQSRRFSDGSQSSGGAMAHFRELWPAASSSIWMEVIHIIFNLKLSLLTPRKNLVPYLSKKGLGQRCLDSSVA